MGMTAIVSRNASITSRARVDGFLARPNLSSIAVITLTVTSSRSVARKRSTARGACPRSARLTVLVSRRNTWLLAERRLPLRQLRAIADVEVVRQGAEEAP